MCNCIEKLKEEIIKENVVDDKKPIIDDSRLGLSSIQISYKPWSSVALRYQLRWSTKSFRFKFCPFCGEKI